MEIKDSGERRKFDTGATRDIADGKGRCDLLPLDIVAEVLINEGYDGSLLRYIEFFIRTGDEKALFYCIRKFAHIKNWNLITEMLEVSGHYEDGARKYAERNWEKGIPLHCYIDSGVRHYLKYLRGDTDEPHDRAFIWNMLGALWTVKHLPEMNDLPFKNEQKNKVVV